MKTDSKLELKLKRGSRYHTNFELKTIKQYTRTFSCRFKQNEIETVASKSYNQHKTIENGNEKILKRMLKPEYDLTGQMQAI